MENDKKNTALSENAFSSFFDICIIGGGPSGMAAAVTAKSVNPRLNICIMEKKERLGKKLLATGNGRCNITNLKCDEFTHVKFFLEENGIIIKEESEGRMYPYSQQASSVVQLFESRIESLNIKVLKSCQVTEIKDLQDGFIITGEQEGTKQRIKCKNVLLSCGGKSAPHMGTTGDGYKLANSIGHKTSPIYPVLTPIECTGDVNGLKGVRCKGSVKLMCGGKIIHEELGEIQFIEKGLSGICIFNLSRHIKLDKNTNEAEGKAKNHQEGFKEYTLTVDLLPNMPYEELVNILKERREKLSELSADMYLHSLVNEKPAEKIIESVLRDRKKGKFIGEAVRENTKHLRNAKIKNITDKEIEAIAKKVKNLKYTVTGVKGWKDAQCTGGGVRLEEINSETMESKLKKGFYLAGEVMNYDGPCGGFNLNHAWLSGMKAGRAMAGCKKQSVD